MNNQSFEENLLIFGDNIEGLKYLKYQSNLKEKINLIYIDPPFATNRDFKITKDRASSISQSINGDIAYTDKILGNDYLNFLSKRFEILYDLLSKDGSIYVHIDYKIGHYVKILMDEIFGIENFRNDITRIKCNPKNFSRNVYGNIKDMILFYTKTDKYKWNNSHVQLTKDEIEKRFKKTDSCGRQYTTTPLHAPGETKNGRTGKNWRGLFPPEGRHWRYPPDELERLDNLGLIEWSSTGNPRKIIFADEMEKRGKKRQDVWTFKDPQYPNYPTEKNLNLLKSIIKASSDQGDVVLDCFCGSGTTLIAAEILNRKWIGIDNSHLAIEIFLKKYMNLKHKNDYTKVEIT